MEKWVIVETTDNKNIGNVYEVPYVDHDIAFNMSGNRFWFDDIKYENPKLLILRNSNYYVILKKLS